MAQQQKYTEEELYLMQKEAEIQAAQQQNSNSQIPYASAMFGGGNKQNLVEWELDFSDALIDIERLLRCDVLAPDKDGNEKWVRNPDQDNVVFNQQGVNDILRLIILLVNKNKVLSYYKVEEVRMRVRMIGHELRAYIYNNYEKYGIDNEYKMNNYPSMVLAVLDVIEAAYRRALNGETHRGLGEARVVTQNEPLMPQNINVYPGQGGGQKRGMISKMMPWNWGKG